MKTVEEIEKEYESYKMKSDFVTTIDEFSCFIEIGIEDAKEQINSFFKEMKINSRLQKLTSIKNIFLQLVQQQEIAIFEDDNLILEEMINYVNGYIKKFTTLFSLSTEDNFTELTKLVDFSCEYYNKHMDYFESKRDALEYSCKGISYFNGKYTNDITTFDEFFEKKVDIILKENNKKLYKVKK